MAASLPPSFAGRMPARLPAQMLAFPCPTPWPAPPRSFPSIPKPTPCRSLREKPRRCQATALHTRPRQEAHSRNRDPWSAAARRRLPSQRSGRTPHIVPLPTPASEDAGGDEGEAPRSATTPLRGYGPPKLETADLSA